jgi:hypothetical protein
MLDAGESLFLGGSHHLAVHHQGRGGVVEVARQTKDLHGATYLEVSGDGCVRSIH